MTPLLVHVRPIDPATGNRVDVRLFSGGDAAAAGLGGFIWESAIVRRPRVSIEILSETLDGKVQTGRGDLVLNVEAIRQVAKPFALNWSDAPVIIYDASALDLATAPVEFSGIVRSAPPDLDGSTLTLNFEVPTLKLDRPVLVNQFDGSGGLGGDPEKRGLLKPAGFGDCPNIEPVFFDEDRNIGMLDGYGNLVTVNWLGEGLNNFGASVGDYPSYSALAAAIDADLIPEGRWATCLADGLIALGAPPTGVITCDAVFNTNRPGALMRRLIEFHAGVPTGEIDVASFIALDVAVNRPVHYWTSEQRQVLELIEAIAASCNATPWLDLQGRVSVSRAFDGLVSGTLNRLGSSVPRAILWAAGEAEPPAWRMTARCARPGRVMNYEEVNYEDDLIDRGSWSPIETYRQGNLVWLPDGSQFLYTNATPSAGTAPPSPPATVNSHWTRTREPTTAADLYYLDGTPIEDLKPQAAGATRNVESIFDPMDYATVDDFLKNWEVIFGDPAQIAIIASPDTGGLSVRFGDNSGNDMFILRWKGAPIAYAPEDLYEVAYDIQSLAGSGAFYLGVDAISAAGASLPSDSGDYHYFAAQASQTAFGRQTRRGYMRGTATPGTGAYVGDNAFDPAAPNPCATGTVILRPLVIVNFNGAAGTAVLHSAGLRKVDDATVIWTGAWSSTRTYARNEGVTSAEGRGFASRAPGNLNHQPPTSATSDAFWYLVADKGVDGAGATPLYTWNAFADSPDGTINFTTGSPGGRAYRGEALNKTSSTESSNPGDYVWSLYRGPAAFGLVASANAVVGPDFVIKNGVTTAWDAQAYSTESFTGGCVASAQVPTSSTDAIFGINADPTTDASFTSIDYAWFFRAATGQCEIYESGSAISAHGSFSPSTVLQVRYRGQTIEYLKDGVVVRTVSTTSGRTFFFDSSLYFDLGRLEKIRWAAAGADGDEPVTVAPASQSFVVAATSSGAPKAGALPKTVTFSVTQGGIDLSDDAATDYQFASAPVNCTASFGGINGKVLSITAMSADTAAVEVEILRDSVTVGIITVSLDKAKDGVTGGASQNDVTLSLNNTASYTGTQGGPVTVPVGPNGTITIDVDHNYTVGSNSATLAGKVQYRTTPGSGAWTDIGSEQSGSTAFPTEPGSLTLGRTLAGPASAANWEFQYINRKTGSGTLSNSGSNVFQVSWGA